MATSGTYGITVNRDDIIEAIYKDVLGIKNYDASMKESAVRQLNYFVMYLTTQGVHLWAKGEGIIVPEADTVAYTLGDATGTDTVFKVSGLVETDIGADEASGQTAITVDSSTGMAASDVVLIELDDDTLHKSTISSVDDATTITIADALPSAAADGNSVYTYTASTDLIEGVTEVIDARLRGSDGTDIVLNELSHAEYNQLYSKNQEGDPTAFFVDYQLSAPVMYLYPEPCNLKKTVRFTYATSLQSFSAATDNPHFPSEWVLAIEHNVAYLLATGTGLSASAPELKLKADEYLRRALAWDREKVPIKLRRKL